jgi:hypothetical protein
LQDISGKIEKWWPLPPAQWVIIIGLSRSRGTLSTFVEIGLKTESWMNQGPTLKLSNTDP